MMIDIHSHILPGLDDGVENLPGSIQLAFEYQAAGIGSVIATPHIKDGIYDVSKDKIQSAVEVLNIEIALAGLNVDIYAGAEYYMDIRVLKDLESGKLVTLGKSTFVLVEFPSYSIPAYSNTIIDILIEKGYTPVIAHPERCRDFRKNPRILDTYIDKGCRVQLDSRSLTGENGKSMMNLSFSFIKNGKVDFIGLDIHRSFSVSKHLGLLGQALQTMGDCTVGQFMDRDELFTGKGNLELRK